jgi:hypothetical protein
MGRMSGFAKIVRSTIALLRFPGVDEVPRPLFTMWARVSNYANSHSFERGTLPTTPLISKQAVPYRTRGGTCCHGVSTPKTRSLAYSSMTNHITWRIPTISTIPTHAQITTSILTTVISYHDGWKTKTINNNTSRTQHHKDGKTCMTLMIAWLSITNQVWDLGNNINACKAVYILERESIYDQYG